MTKRTNLKHCRGALMKYFQDQVRHIGRGILKVNSFLNHQVDCYLMDLCGRSFADYFIRYKPTKVLTLETSGILPAAPTALHLRGVPLIFASHKKLPTFSKTHKLYQKTSKSHTRNKTVDIFVSSEFLKSTDRVVIIDDTLASGRTLLDLADIVCNQAGAKIVGIGVIMEKEY
eukprot:UN24507